MRRSIVTNGSVVSRDNARRGPNHPGSILELPTLSPAIAGRRCSRQESPARSIPPHHDAPRGVILEVLPARLFLSPTTTARPRDGHSDARGRRGWGNDDDNSNSIAQAGQTLGTSLMYLFFATTSAPGWRLKDSIQKLFPSIASFLVVFYGVHGCALLGARWLITCAATAASSSGGKDSEDNTVMMRRRRRKEQKFLGKGGGSATTTRDVGVGHRGSGDRRSVG